MSQKEKARAIVDADYQFTAKSSLPPEEVISRARRAAEASKRGLGAGIRHEGDGSRGDAQTASFSVRGPGGVMGIMHFVVAAAPEGDSTSVRLDVGDFVFQKGSLGMKPTINAKSTMQRFLSNFRAEL